MVSKPGVADEFLLFNLDGKVLVSKSVKGLQNFDVRCTPGIYFCQLRGSGQLLSKGKLIFTE
jgi:hypothetical protein